ncbi:SDR family oxidoreductase [Amycolatopsis sp. H6(2020)]|nr:SDR family oxidoreductase [Amycolatopsis sp. H6(2020)]
MSTIGIIGGHGKVALLAAPLLVEQGHRVRSVIRKQEQIADVEQTGAEAVVRDVMDLSTDQIAALFRDQALDAVVWSAGVGGGDPERTWKVDRDAAIRTMDAAVQAGVSRYVMVSYLGSSLEHEVPKEDDFYAYAQSKAEADEHLRGTSLDYTILGPGMLTLEEPTGKIDVTTDPQDADTSRANVVRVIAAVLADDSTIGKAIPFTDGDTAIAEAVAGAPESTRLA